MGKKKEPLEVTVRNVHLDENHPQSGTVTVDPERMLLTVHPHRKREHYSMLLTDVASLVVSRVVKLNLQAGGVDVPKARR
jgi:hypothetical protein